MFRLAKEEDIKRVTEIYDHIHDAEEAGDATIGWDRQVYPTSQTAVEGVAKGDLFVEEIDDCIVATAKINQLQVKEYADCHWSYQASAHQVMVLHTLVVDSQIKGKGYGTAFVKFYEEFALSKDCHYLRIDTQEKNIAARKFYKKLGFSEAGIVPCDFNGIPNVRLVCLEKKL